MGCEEENCASAITAYQTLLPFNKMQMFDFEFMIAKKILSIGGQISQDNWPIVSTRS